MPTLTEIANALGIDKSLASRYAKRKMPLDSIEAARAWKAANVRPRMASIGLARRVAAELVDRDLETAAGWVEAFVTMCLFAQRDLHRYLPAVWYLYVNGLGEGENRKRMLDPGGEVPAEFWTAFDAYCVSVNCTWRPI